jgi:hypothetical protein
MLEFVYKHASHAHTTMPGVPGIGSSRQETEVPGELTRTYHGFTGLRYMRSPLPSLSFLMLLDELECNTIGFILSWLQ